MTDTPRRKRKLAAILMLDVVGFSRLMGQDEEGTTAAILDFHAMVREVVDAHGGRVVGTAGDSVFGDFDSIVEALSAAEQIQRALHAANADRRDDERIEARIGLHLGDVIVEERNVFGDGVNIAARLEQLAEPGGIMLSEAAYHLVRGRTALPIEMVGPQTLKNIDEPIEVYRIRRDAFGARPAVAVAPSESAESPRSETNERIREAVARIAERMAEKVEETDERIEERELKQRARAAAMEEQKVVTLFKAGNLTLIAIGVAGVVAFTSGWSENGWYPFLGCWLLGIGLGGAVQRIVGREGIALILNASGVAVGAAFFDNGVTKAIFWILATAMLGAAIQKLASSRRP